MRTVKNYFHGGIHPEGGDPRRKAEQLAFAQLLQEKADEEKFLQALLDQGSIGPQPRYYRHNQPMPSITAQALKPELRPQMPEELGMALEYLTPVGDVMGLTTGLADLGKGIADLDPVTAGLGALNTGLSLASVFIPGRIPEIGEEMVGNMGKYTIRKRNPQDPRVWDINHPEFTENNVVEIRANDARPNSFGQSRPIATLEANTDHFDQFHGRDVYVPYIAGEIGLKSAGTSMTQKDMAAATLRMLQEIPNGGMVHADSFSTNSLPIFLARWRQGRLSAKQIQGNSGDGMVQMTHNALNDMGLSRYKNSPAVEAWHEAQARAAKAQGNPIKGKISDGYGGFETFDNSYLPSNQMSKEQFFQIDPHAAQDVAAGNMKKAEQRYRHYQIQSDNDFGISPLTGETTMAATTRASMEEAQQLADIFNARMREHAAFRAQQVDKLTAKGRTLAQDEGVLEAVIKPLGDGTYEVHYPTPIMEKNFRKGGKYKLKKRRPRGMQIKR